jgi:basic membrane lipoprotein Med (substrate-binding protein (PBP1-ABC) superfamily)/DNA-binding SARP family transcriptional activator
MDFRVLGALEAGSGGTLVELGPPKQRAVLAILLLHVGQIVPVDRLIELVWGEEPPRTADHSIQIYVSELRKALEPLAGGRLIHRRPPGYQLNTPAESVDANRFEALVRQGSAQITEGEREAAIRTLRSALELWRGPALSDFAYEEFAQPYVRRFHDLHLDAVETLAAAELDAGETMTVVPLLEAAIRDDPLRERSRELLMIALYRSGRHAEALRTYEKLRELLVDELGLEPSPPLQQLRDRVLLHDATLLPGPLRPTARGTARNPYKGLQPFGEEDADDFFGRDAIVEQLLGILAGGQRLIGLVGPSGSGKSSVVAAGLLPRLRHGAVPGSDRWVIAPVALGPDPLADLRAVLARIGKGKVGDDLALPALADGERVVIVLDQFEQVFTASEESRRNEFLRVLAGALSADDSRLAVVITLRADYYDRPLQHPEFGEVFVPGVVHVLPMMARELEAAVVAPAERVGVAVEPSLLAEVVAESVARPGSLPLLQYALTELFEQRSEPMLTLAGYTALGGLRGVLTRRAEATFLGLEPEEQRIATQVFLRLVRLGRGTADSRRRLTLSELTDLGVDAVALSAVLTAFGRHRLLTFDRDDLTGQSTVELAHEALLTEWERLAGWIDRHRSALRRRDALLAAVDEWELSGRNPEYLLTGARLAELEAWRQEGSLPLTAGERAFLEAGVERRQAEVSAEVAREADHLRLARTARTRLLGLAAAAVVAVGLGGAVVYGILTAPPPPPSPVAYLWTQQGGIVSAQAVSGFDRAVADFGLVGLKIPVDDLFAALDAELGEGWDDGISRAAFFAEFSRVQRDQMRELATEGVGLLMTWNAYVGDIETIAREFPETHFATEQQVSLPNVAVLTFADSEPSYLAGVAAALTSETGTIGYIAGVSWDFLWGFHAGYEAGARSVDPDIEILVGVVHEDDITGFSDESAARQRALEMYGDGADVIFQAAGSAGLGVFQAASELSDREGRHVWAIGVDSDQYETVMELPGANGEAWRQHILTSALKEHDTITYAILAEHAEGKFTPGPWNWGLASGAQGLSYSGGYINHLRPMLDDLQAKIISGEIVVPCVPRDHLELAADFGIDPDHCHEGRQP